MFGSDYAFLASIPPLSQPSTSRPSERGSLGVEQTEEKFLIEFHHFE
jgi:hypothetical protein